MGEVRGMRRVGAVRTRIRTSGRQSNRAMAQVYDRSTEEELQPRLSRDWGQLAGADGE